MFKCMWKLLYRPDRSLSLLRFYVLLSRRNYSMSKTSSEINRAVQACASLFSSNRLCSSAGFYCLRILLRDPEYQLLFVQENGMIGLKTVDTFFQISPYSNFLSHSKWIFIWISTLPICVIVTMNRIPQHRKCSDICWVSE